mmetsp:Transcript_11029/g.33826  ORF Transcript_11029/g.33826 Transcript_11029/m.33826 type:complete len:448 (+) Transcript_11029:92-1435(+)|eukprot:CAMPEP_0198724784 /NCGR_PEP_ID=MMETSP1475-20131203/2206_1 /TAXON_ID= ORGANISM="Unidentified sp., Strain CCMP1999" /NCGR_SAMPLE_ID=MMETSP1475 /ASSEMBLY_ACC=CAM_ASM_001111 /LENGTH=447 /DNA_ID=CAMNT_0044486405 /DNA_START=53 /DNA_END=1396 /DNA_ORIENTATION=-
MGGGKGGILTEIKEHAPVKEKTVNITSTVVPIRAPVQNYAWGKKGGDSNMVAKIHSRNAMRPIDYERPYAELWIGAHTSAPATLLHDPSTSLIEFLEREGPKYAHNAKSFELPYLLKVLSVGGALSIQAHPDKALAAKLHADKPAAYKDDNYKPEMTVALDEFEALCGFRACEDISSDLKRVPEFAAAAGRVDSEDFIKLIRGRAKRPPALRTLFASLMRQTPEKIASCLDMLVERLEKQAPEDLTEQDNVLLDLASQYPGDVGCFAAYMMNKLTLQQGEAIFIGANEPHAYLKGECIEIMANSDNVVRAGLTPKFKDVDVLVNMLTYKDGRPEVMMGQMLKDHVRVYRPPCNDFQLERIELPAGKSVRLDASKGPAMFLTVSGEGTVSLGLKESSTSMALFMGSIYFCHPNEKLRISNTGDETLIAFRSSINEAAVSEGRNVCRIQ